jgi:hypothetical protein
VAGGSSDGASIDDAQPANTAFTLTLSVDKALVLQGDTATLTVQLQRKAGFVRYNTGGTLDAGFGNGANNDFAITRYWL